MQYYLQFANCKFNKKYRIGQVIHEFLYPFNFSYKAMKEESGPDVRMIVCVANRELTSVTIRS